MTRLTTSRFHRIGADLYQYGRVTFDHLIICALVAVVGIGVFSGMRKLTRDPAYIRSGVVRARGNRSPVVGVDHTEEQDAPLRIKSKWPEESDK